jgi:hypothetical protein
MPPEPTRKIIPYILSKKQTEKLTLYKLSLFVALGGRALWELSAAENPEETLTQNDFVVDTIHSRQGVLYAEINPEKTNLAAFYTWDETKKEDCWRTFHICLDPESGKQWFRSEHLETRFEGTLLTPSSVFADILSLKT